MTPRSDPTSLRIGVAPTVVNQFPRCTRNPQRGGAHHDRRKRPADSRIMRSWARHLRNSCRNACRNPRSSFLDYGSPAQGHDRRPKMRAAPISAFARSRGVAQSAPHAGPRRSYAADIPVRYTKGEASALTIIAREIRHHSICDLPIEKIRRHGRRAPDYSAERHP
jgi:hypothetical protein